jgi:hypothetical protein
LVTWPSTCIKSFLLKMAFLSLALKWAGVMEKVNKKGRDAYILKCHRPKQ